EGFPGFAQRHVKWQVARHDRRMHVLRRYALRRRREELRARRGERDHLAIALRSRHLEHRQRCRARRRRLVAGHGPDRNRAVLSLVEPLLDRLEKLLQGNWLLEEV